MTKKAKKPRSRPAFDRAVKALHELLEKASREHWSPVKLRDAIREARDVSREVWRQAVKHVFGVGILELPDLRQLELFEGA